MIRRLWAVLTEWVEALRAAWTHPRHRPRRRPHLHYCEAHDRRWACDADLCLLHEAAPCPDRVHVP
jgi:hypothetical protein